MIQLGKTYSDVITGFQGIAIGRVQYISGCNQVLLAPGISTDGAFRESQWIDEMRLKENQCVDVIKLPMDVETSSPGFDRPAPKR
jgi:hypothetical protein